MTYRVAMAISGAVSLGSYEAGCVYELLNAFKEHNANPQNTPIEIDVLTGASAGGMTAAMIAQKLLYDKDALDGEESNVGYEAWVKSVDIDGLLMAFEGDNAKTSLLSNGFIKDIANKLILNRYAATPAPQERDPHTASAEFIRLGLAMSNLNGVDYNVQVFSYGTESLAQDTFTQTRHQDRFTEVLGWHSDTFSHWENITTASRACGAFPLAFSPIRMTRQWQHDDYKARDAVKFEENEFCFVDGGTFNNYPLGMAVDLAKMNDTENTDYKRRFYFYISPTKRESTANPTFNSDTSNLLEIAAQLGTSIFTQSGFQEWLIQAKNNALIIRLDEQAITLRDEYYLLSQESIAAEQAIITPLILQTFSGNNGDESYENAFARLAEQYAEDVKDKPLSPDAFKLWIDTIAVLEKSAELGLKDLKTIYTISADEDCLVGDLLQSFLGFFDEKFRYYDYQRGRLNAMHVINGILSGENTSEKGVKQLIPGEHLPLNISARDTSTLDAYFANSTLNKISVKDVDKPTRDRVFKRVKSRYYLIAKDSGLGWIIRTALWNFVVKQKVRKALYL